MTSSPSDRWLEPLPKPPPAPREAFERIVNAACSPAERIPARPAEVRRALAYYLRSIHHPAARTPEPWQPADPCFRPFRSVIQPLLSHPIWVNNTVIAAPFTLYHERPSTLGYIDALIQHPDRSIGAVILQATRRSDARAPAAQAELGAAIAAIIDRQVTTITHAITLWAGPDATEAEYHSPSLCLGLWCDAVDLSRFAASTVNAMRTTHVPSGDHTAADPSGHSP